jgi:hypothetical protein
MVCEDCTVIVISSLSPRLTEIWNDGSRAAGVEVVVGSGVVEVVVGSGVVVVVVGSGVVEVVVFLAKNFLRRSATVSFKPASGKLPTTFGSTF